MKQIHQPQKPAPAGAGKGFWLLLGAVALLGVSLVASWARRSSAGDAVVAPESDPGSDQAVAKAVAEEVVRVGGETNPPPATAADQLASVSHAATVPPPQMPAFALPPPSAESRQRVNGLCQLDAAAGPMTAPRAALWKLNFEQLVQGGAGSVPAIVEFLKSNKDWPFGAGDAELLGYSSARTAMLDGLVRIGGAEGIGALGNILQTTAVPREIALLASSLESLAPEQYRAQAVEAARQSLAMAEEKQLEGIDVAPLFEVFRQFGDASIVPDLEKATSQWRYYAVATLANLPDNVGLPALFTMADPSKGSGNRLPALEMLAQLAGDNPAARQVLAAQVANQQIPANYWAYLRGPLAGEQYYSVEAVLTTYPAIQSSSDIKSTHINSGNQNFYQLPSEASRTADGLNQRITLVNELIKATSEPAALQALQQAQATLQNRLGRLAAAPPSPDVGNGQAGP